MQAADPICAGCGGVGWYKLALPVGHPQFGKLQRCQCLVRGWALTPEEVAGQMVQEAEPKRPPTTAEALRAGHIESLKNQLSELGELGQCRFSTFDVWRDDLTPIVVNGQTVTPEYQRQHLARALQAAEAYASAIDGAIVFYGPFGAGKSHLAASIAHDAVLAGWAAEYASVPHLISWLRDGYADHSTGDRRVRVEQTDLLVLDDLKPLDDPKEEAIIFEIVNARVISGRAIVATSNHPLAQHGRIGSRLAGMAGRERVIWLPVCDHRFREWKMRAL